MFTARLLELQQKASVQTSTYRHVQDNTYMSQAIARLTYVLPGNLLRCFSAYGRHCDVRDATCLLSSRDSCNDPTITARHL